MNRNYIPLLLLVSACTQHLPARTQVQANIGLHLASGCDEVKNVVAHVADEQQAATEAESSIVRLYGKRTVTDHATGAAASETLRQVSQVDEAELVKTDGTYIYSLSSLGVGIARYETAGKIGKVSTLDFKSDPIGLYLTDDHRLVAVGQIDDQVEVRSYDVTQASAPQLIGKQVLAGYHKASRLHRGHLRIITQIGDRYPSYAMDASATRRRLTDYLNVDDTQKCEKYHLANAEVGAGLTMLATMDTNFDHLQKQFIFGDSMATDMYDTGETLYIFQQHWDNWSGLGADVPRQNYTYLHEFKFLDDGTPVYQSSLGVEGHLLNQYAVDWYQNTLRLALTQNDGNRVAILQKQNSRWRMMGQTELLAAGEQIYAARFMGPTAYIVTYYQMDPLFVIDLQDPTSPHKIGELHLPGVSTFLLPITERTVLGIGRSERGKTKLSLFDVSNPAQPRLSSEWEDPDWSYSEVNYNFKAISWQPALQRLSFPQIAYADEGNIYRAPVFQITEDHGIRLQSTITASISDPGHHYEYDFGYFRRLLLIDQTVVFDFDNRMQAYDLATPNELGSDLTFFSSTP